MKIILAALLIISGSACAGASPGNNPGTPKATPAVAGCPCSGTNLCIGPRGGRYCITSGGNKRYVK